MKANQIARCVLVLYASACVNKAPANTDKATPDKIASATSDTTATAAPTIAASPFPTGKVIDTVVCQSDPTQSYALYIPATAVKAPLPVLYFFDPHADGALPLNKYKSLADTYGFILVGSNNSKNGNDWTAADNIWRVLSGDTEHRLKINSDRMYTVGFSGGAKVAGYIALNHPEIKGIIAGGAGLPDGAPAGDFSFSFTGIAGEGDMNMTELVTLTSELDKSRTRHRLIFFDGKHEWAPEQTMDIAFAGLQFDAMQKGFIPKDDSFIHLYITKSKKKIDADDKAGQLIKAEQECQLSVSLLNGLTDEVAWFNTKAAMLNGNPLFQKQQKAQHDLLVTEENTKAGYQDHFQQADMNYWDKTIRDLQAKAATKTAERPMYQRLLAYLSLAFYSFSNRLISANQNDAAAHFVELYKMADPTNSEAWYFSAILHGREGQAQATENDLLKAADNGFKDKDRMHGQPEFKNFGGQMDFLKIESRMRAKP